MPDGDGTETEFLAWAASHGCVLSSACELAHFDGMGRGVRATRDIAVDELLFKVPRTMLLNLRSSTLRSWCEANPGSGSDDASSSVWAQEAGWAPLILSMMWEAWRSSESGRSRWEHARSELLKRPEGWTDSPDQAIEWAPYFKVMPIQFDTPMMWEEKELEELKGTDVLERIGKSEADASYVDLVRPYIARHPTIILGLDPADVNPSAVDAAIEEHYSLETFHIMGSRVLSRSFHVKDEAHAEQSDEDDSEDQDEQEDTADISMVPMADMLNARYASDNARLFFKTDVLEMRNTEAIPAGAQIFNTFGDPPNGDLLRRYGHVDVPNGADTVDVEASTLGKALCELFDEHSGTDSPIEPATRRQQIADRVKWLCDSEDALIDDAFAVTYLSSFPPSATFTTIPDGVSDDELRATLKEGLEDGMVPEEMIQMVRALGLQADEWEKSVRGKGRLPSAKLGAGVDPFGWDGSITVADVVIRALQLRLRAYPTTLEADIELLSQELPPRKRAAVVVRVGEKRILSDLARAFEAVKKSASKDGKAKPNGAKRVRGDGSRSDSSASKKAKS